MKKYILLAIVALGVGGGCQNAKDGLMVTDYKVINLTESEIIIELGITDRQTQIIHTGDIQTIYSNSRQYNGVRPESAMSIMILEHLNPEMSIVGNVVPNLIWHIDNWKYEGSDVSNPKYYNATYTLIVTDELLQKLNGPQIR